MKKQNLLTDEQSTLTEKRISDNKKLLLEQLKKIPIVQIACEKTDIGRATYYRWRNEDAEFAKAADEAISDGVSIINDMAESQLLTNIKNGNMTAILYWLKHRHKAYSTRVEIEGTINNLHELTAEQKMLLDKAVDLVFGENND